MTTKITQDWTMSDWEEFKAMWRFRIPKNMEHLVAGEDGTDQELIEKVLGGIENRIFDLSFIDTKNGGYFHIKEFDREESIEPTNIDVYSHAMDSSKQLEVMEDTEEPYGLVLLLEYGNRIYCIRANDEKEPLFPNDTAQIYC